MDNRRRLGAGWRRLGAAALVLPLVGVSVAFGQGTGNVYNVYPLGYTGTKVQPAFTGLLAAYYTCASNGDGNKACPARVIPGDTILVHAGTYLDDPADYSFAGLGTPFDGTYYLTAKGTADKPISIVAAGDGPVIFDGGGIYLAPKDNGIPRNHNLFNVMAADYNLFRGITVRNTDIGFLAGIAGIAGATGLTFENITIQNVRYSICDKGGCLPYGHNAHDFNGDGTSDILWSDTSGDLAMWLMSAGQVSSAAMISQVPTNWSVVGTRDFNGDGMGDILWRDTAGDTAIWEMNGTTVLNSSGLGNIPTNWTVVGTGDFNGDGKGDILWRDTAGDTAIWEMNGTTILNSSGLGNIPTNWTVQATGDFNGDGMTDILWRDTAGDLAIWEMNGTTVLNSSSLGNIPTNWTVVGTGDFNGDGTTDIIWRNNSGLVAIWLMSNGQVLSSATWQLPMSWSVAETGDFNDDGMSDILWIDQSGDLTIWLMDGLKLNAYDGLGNVGTTWTVQGQNAD